MASLLRSLVMKVDLNSSEYITGVCGKYSWNSYVNQDTIRSLCFYTNEKQYGPFGRYEGNRVESFSSRIEGGVVVGFHGCIGGGKQLASIGFYAKPGDVGPWGIAGGLSWDDGVFSEVTQVFVNTDQSHNVIHGIKFEYAETNGKRVLSKLHGSSTNSDVVKKIDLSKNGEFVVGIAGLYGPLKGNESLEGIRSLWINTNKEKHGPFGNGTRGTHFASNASKGKVVGFQGRSGSYLNAIGLHTEYF
ncbi:hypothetical protein RJ640_022553 [Escallonia rubra]|uniref:Jacalin-type lectin domain-containing protein n=1 Tax=Escallonia rubra TaxID=112253 RepID=A0AA88RST6_9ASTE|nr:hypothetical protein RJ640_022553 [Escallonia rubra]